ncbi:unnamed protein product [Trichogramma brassicae]|uniref:RNA-directed DNA polymerase n=1 Tax=Trichogramma brassicae TaxID=86971 RepID=A0A6H5IFP4_9HYME|nr:unnamed protein product [Trichogramma brassicae]
MPDLWTNCLLGSNLIRTFQTIHNPIKNECTVGLNGATIPMEFVAKNAADESRLSAVGLVEKAQREHTRMEVIINFPRPNSLEQLRRFLGMCSWYRKFLKDYTTLTEPLTKLTRTKVKYVWSTEHQDAFETTQLLDEQRLVEHLYARSSSELVEARYRRVVLCDAGLRPYSRVARTSRLFCKAFPVTPHKNGRIMKSRKMTSDWPTLTTTPDASRLDTSASAANCQQTMTSMDELKNLILGLDKNLGDKIEALASDVKFFKGEFQSLKRETREL